MLKAIVGMARKAINRHERYVRLLHRFQADHVVENEKEHPTIYIALDAYVNHSGM